MIPMDPEKILANARQADTEDLLDRVTIYRPGMEPEAVEIIERELFRRGITQTQIHDHAVGRQEQGTLLENGLGIQCYHCRRPAVVVRWGWQRLLGRIPLFPRRFYFCQDHKM